MIGRQRFFLRKQAQEEFAVRILEQQCYFPNRKIPDGSNVIGGGRPESVHKT